MLRTLGVAVVLVVAVAVAALPEARGEPQRRQTPAPPAAEVGLPSTAVDPLWVRDRTSGTGVAVSLVGALPGAPTRNSGAVRFRGALGDGADVLLVARPDGVEDYAVLPRRPADGVVAYDLDVSEVAGLRLRGNVLELLDGLGFPRLRVAPPYLVDRDGRRLTATLKMAPPGEPGGCRVDHHAAPPWRRPPLPPCGSRLPCVCRLLVRLPPARYPVVVDPAWTTTGSLAWPRAAHTATALPGGEVLIAGGYGQDGEFPAYTEIYSPQQGVWAVGPEVEPRGRHTATVLADGRVLLAGGRRIPDGILDSAEVVSQDGATGVAPMPGGPRWYHTSTPLDGGSRVLVAGGRWSQSSTAAALASALVFDSTALTWSAATPMKLERARHSATALSDTVVLVAGGSTTGSGPGVAEAETYDAALDAWTDAPPMSIGRMHHTATRMLDGAVVVAGGTVSTGSDTTPSVERLDPQSGAWQPLGPMADERRLHTATLLADGSLLVAGGRDAENVPQSSSERLIDGSWHGAGVLADLRASHTATLLADGAVLLTGGEEGILELASSELFALLPGGLPCSRDGECASGNCTSAGVCCDGRCDGPCLACTRGEKATGGDGECGPVAGNPCLPYVCTAAGICAAGCDDHDACSLGYVCRDGSCVAGLRCDGHTLLGATGVAQECTPYRCDEAGECLAACRSTADCAPARRCDASGRCVAEAPATATATGCAAGGRAPLAGAMLLLSAAMAAAWGLRRRRWR